VQQAVRFGLFHTMQAAARAEEALPSRPRVSPVPGTTATRSGTPRASFVLPVLTAHRAEGRADALRWRYNTIDLARDRARALGLRGATFPWRTIRGHECLRLLAGQHRRTCTSTPMIATAAVRYVDWTGDEDFDRTRALPLLVETARCVGIRRVPRRRRQLPPGRSHRAGRVQRVADDDVYTNLIGEAESARGRGRRPTWPDDAVELGGHRR